MDQEQLQKLIVEMHSKLSPRAQEVFSSMVWADTLSEVEKKYALNETQIANLGTETTLALLGVIGIDEYEKEVARALARPDEITKKILAEIRERIFSGIMQDLADAHSKNKDKQISIEDYTDPRLASLPPVLLSAISESGYQKKLYELGTKHKLAVDTMAGLEDLTIQFMKGEIEPAQYEKELVASLGIKPDASKEIASDINTTILLPIRELMKKEEQKAVTTPDIPFPPYRPTIDSTLPKTQSGILATAGIEMINDDYTQNDRSVPTTKNEGGVLTQAGISVIDEKRSLNEEHILPSPSNRNRALEGIEHPAKTMTSIHEEKLQKTITSTPQTSDYSLPKIGGGDIYREPIG